MVLVVEAAAVVCEYRSLVFDEPTIPSRRWFETLERSERELFRERNSSEYPIKGLSLTPSLQVRLYCPPLEM